MNGHAPAVGRAMAVPAAQRLKWGFAEWFAISQTALPAILILPGTQSFRLPIRTSAFAISLAAVAWYVLSPKAKLRQSGAQSWVFAVMALLVV